MFFKVLTPLFLFCQIASADLDSPPFGLETPTDTFEKSEQVSSINKKKAVLFSKKKNPSAEAVISAVVNGVPISMTDLKNRLKLVLKTPLDSLPSQEQSQVKQQILKVMIDDLLKIQTTEKLGLKASPKDIETTITHLEKQNNLPRGGFKKMLKKKGVPEAILISSIKADLLWRQYVSILAGNSLEVNKKELKDIIKSSQSDSPQYHLAEIEIYNAGFEGDFEKALEKIMQIMEELKSGKPFMMLAHNQSQAPSAARGGDIGWIRQDMIDPDTLETIEGLESGQVTSPLKTESGYKIVLLIAKKESKNLQPTLTARQIEIKVDPAIAQDQKVLSKEIEKLEKLVGTVNKCLEFDQLTDQIPNSQIHVYESVRLGDLSSDLRTVLKDLKKGVPSKAVFNSANSTIVFFLICERNETPSSKISSVQGVASQISNQRFISIAEQKLREIKRIASIEIRL
jgi:peptidyl-prolyl cis-trans isomerase SurA